MSAIINGVDFDPNWNNWVRGRSATRLQRPKGGWTAENFPTPEGV
jgi:hypothetical protein